VMVNGLRKAEYSATAAQLRGFDSGAVHSFYKPFHWTLSGVGMLAFFFLVIVGLHVTEAIGLASLLPSLTGDISTF